MRTIAALLLLLLCSTAVAVDRDVKFCNEYPRVSATLLAKTYREAKVLSARWYATDEAQRMTVLADEVIHQAQRMTRCLEACRRTRDQWLAEGGTSLVPNTADVIVDGAPNDGRPRVTGAYIVGAITQVGEYANWLDHGTYASTYETSDSGAHRHAILRAANSTADNLSADDAATVITRCGELIAAIEANTFARLNVILKVAVVADEEVQ